MDDFKGLLFGMLVAVIIYVLDRYLPKWFGAIPGILFLVLMIYIMFTKDAPFWSALTVLLVGEAIFNGIWFNAVDSRKKQEQKELEKMKAKDLS